MSYEKTNGSHAVQGALNVQDYRLTPCVGRIAGVSESMAILVEWVHSGPKEARLMSGLSRSDLSKPQSRGREVLLVFDGADPERPIIVGLLAEPLEGLIAFEISGQQEDPPECAVIDGKRLTLEAQEEIILKCGEGSITLRKDGKIIIKGTHLLSRASGPNRIKGGSVQIN